MPPTTDSIPLLLLQNFAAQAIGYFAVVGLLFLVFWKWGRERFRPRRIPAPDRVDRRQILHEIRATLVTLVVGTTSAGTVIALQATGRTSFTTGPTPAWQTALWIAALLLFNDAWFYGWHRLMHHPRLFRYVHAVHHKSVDVNPFSSYSFHAVEAFILGIWVVPAALWLPIPMAAIGVVQIVGLANNVMSHLGYELLPRWLLDIPLLRLTNTATFHSLHHTRLRGNYGLLTRFWDRLFGTELPEYEATFLARGEGPEARSPSDAAPRTQSTT